MFKNQKILYEVKVKAVEDYLSEKISIQEIVNQLQISRFSMEEWIRKYKAFGANGLKSSIRNKHYSPDIKLKAVTDYINQKGSLYEICIRYKISSHSVLQNWIKKYNSHNNNKAIDSKGDRIMTKGRKTTYEEKVEIVSFCIANSNNYELTANKYNISYQQVYTWVRKYNQKGYNALVDRRGKHRTFEELTESEKLDAQLKLLKAENRRLKMENDFLKKLEEIERR